MKNKNLLLRRMVALVLASGAYSSASANCDWSGCTVWEPCIGSCGGDGGSTSGNGSSGSWGDPGGSSGGGSGTGGGGDGDSPGEAIETEPLRAQGTCHGAETREMRADQVIKGWLARQDPTDPGGDCRSNDGHGDYFWVTFSDGWGGIYQWTGHCMASTFMTEHSFPTCR